MDSLREYKIKIVRDDSPESPREWDNLCTMEYAHPRYILGDKWYSPAMAGYDSWEDYEYYLEKQGYLFLPLYIYDHGGVTMKTTPFGDVWDSGRVGTIYARRDEILKRIGGKAMSRARRQWAYDVMRSEVDEFDTYLRGEVYGYIIEDEEGNQLDSCWGFYGEDDVNYAALEALEGVM